MIYVTHDQEEAMAMSNRICLMNAGAIEQLGTPEELYFRPSTIFAADFLGSSNIYEAVRTANGAQICGCYDVVLPLDRDRADSTDKLALMIRPEHIRLLANDAVEDNTVCATLEQSVVTGALTRLFARLDSGQQIVASMLTMSPDRLPAGSHPGRAASTRSQYHSQGPINHVRQKWSDTKTPGAPAESAKHPSSPRCGHSAKP